MVLMIFKDFLELLATFFGLKFVKILSQHLGNTGSSLVWAYILSMLGYYLAWNHINSRF